MKSTKMSYGDLSSMMLERFKRYAKFGSMAFESSIDYSLADHEHDYSRVEIAPRYNPSSNDGYVLSIASF